MFTISREIWKSLDGLSYNNFEFEGYEVSNKGRLRSVDRLVIDKNGKAKKVKGVIRRLKKNNRGYILVTVKSKGKECTCLIHRLVAMAFLENPNNLPEVNHIDNNKENNSLENLEWITSKDNHNHAISKGFRSQSSENGINSKLSNEQAKEIRQLYLLGCSTYSSIAKTYNVSPSAIRRIVKHESYRDVL